jgi:hypothetical protein
MMQWRWKYFTRNEVNSPDDGSLVINEDALDKLERMRIKVGKPLKINSAYRSIKHNKKVGGEEGSMHRQGRAFDISNKGHNPYDLYQAAIDAGFTGFGFYRTFLHVDTGNKRWWEGGKGNRKLYTDNPAPKPQAPKPIAKPSPQDTFFINDIDAKETEKPNKIEGVPLSDKQKTTVAVTTGVAATGSIATAITDPQIITPALSFLQNVDYRVGLAVCAIIALTGLGYWLWRRK